MILHLCRLAWNRRRTNLLLVGELTLVFLIVGLMGAGWVLFAAQNLRSLGFEYENVWTVNLRRHDWRGESEEQSAALGQTVRMVGREIAALGAVESVALAGQSPFEGTGVWNGITAVNISKEGLETLGLRLRSGRWFEPEDEALSGNRSPVVMDLELSRSLFGDQDPLGKILDLEQVRERYGVDGYLSINMMAPPRFTKFLVVGVVENCLYYGNFGASESKVPGLLFFFFPKTGVDRLASNLGIHLLVKSPSGSAADFGEELRARVRAVVPADQAIRFKVRSLAETHDSKQARQFQNLKNTALISGLVMLMVALGLTGILWQSVRRRTQEIGVRRATGAAGRNVYALFLGELAVLATAAVALGCVPILHFDLLSLVLNSRIPAPVTIGGLATGALVLYLLVLLCGLYPSWLAVRLKPAEALHHE